MSAILPGYTYDIFISYRQKDNKYDGWVTEFVDHLKRELEATFKEDISVYFDENPHDGLLETHIVDKSLRDKLKCLVFVPIISRTYCDPNSFAWQHEFIAFNNLAKEDPLGGEVKLANGNYASRILPVKIHDIETEDNNHIERVLGGIMRPVEFIYRSAGVNRPLKPDDPRTENLNHTYYRDQINKVANAIKEIINALKKPDLEKTELPSEKESITNIVAKTGKKRFILNTKLLGLFTAGLILLIAGGFLLLTFLQKASTEPMDRSIAVLPFTNLSKDPEQDYFSDGMMEEILNHLYKIGDLRVISRTSSMLYRGTMMPIREIARELGTKYILEGSVRKYGNRVRIQTQLINAKGKQEVVWSQDFDRETTIDNILDIQSEVAQKVAFKLKANINPEVRKSIKNHATHNKLAYDLYLKGVQNTSLFWMSDSIEYVNIAMQYHLRALEIDSQFSLAYARLGECYWMLAHFSPNPSVSQWLESERALKKAIDLDPSNGLAYANYGVVQHNWKWDREGAEKSFEKAIQLMPGDIEVHFHAFVYYIRTGNCLKAAEELDQAQSLNPKTSKRNDNAWILLCQGKVTNLTHYSEKLKDIGTSDLVNLYLIEKQYKKAMNLAEIYYKKDDTFKLLYLTYYGVGAALAGEKEKASDIVSQLKEISTYRNVPDSFFAMIYFAMGNDNASYAYLEKALEDREFWIHFLKDTAPFYNHRNDQKFREIMTRSWIPLINSNMQN